jgi:hypothetical protein
MGTWGPGNFDEDAAADLLSSTTSELLEQIVTAMEDPEGLEPDEIDGVMVPCNVELLALIAEQHWVGTTLPDATTVAAWKATYLAVWDGAIDGLAPKPAWKKERRAVLAHTFDRLHAACVAREEPPKAKSGAKPRRRSTR